MNCLSGLWKKLTEKALDQSTDKLEAAFFESVYRVTHASGISLSDNQSITYRIYKFLARVLILLFVASEIWHLCRISVSLDTVIENINVTIMHLLVMYRYKCMEDGRKVYNHLAKSMESPTFDISTPGRKRIFLYWKKMNDRYYKLLLILAASTLSVWYIYPLIDGQDYNLVVALHVPIDYRTPQRYAVVYFVTVSLFHFISCFVVANDLMMQTYLIHMICQFAVLSDCFENILVDCGGDIKAFNNNKIFSDDIFKQRYTQRLGALVEQHKFILNNASKLRMVLSKPMLGQLTASATLICLAGYQVTAAVTDSVPRFLLSLMYLSYNLYNFFLLCRWCDEIKMQSEDIGKSVYCSGWERGIAVVPGVRVRLMLVVARASQPVVLTAGGLYDVSLTSYTTNFAGESPNDMSIRVGTLQNIANELRNLPEFPLDGFKQSGYQRNGPIGVYLSKNVQNYLFYKQGRPNDEGIMLTLFFTENSASQESSADVPEDRRTLFVHREKVPDEVQQVVNKYAQTGRWPGQYTEN